MPIGLSHAVAQDAKRPLPRRLVRHEVIRPTGVVHGVDDGDWPGKRFSVLGRLPRAEARGCSDTYRMVAA